jgi:DNA (cytosine-5)-methyltransferase 1
MRTFTSIEGFCGAGGMALGLKKAGFNSLLAFDKDAAAIESYKKGVGDEGDVIDARKLSGVETLGKIGMTEGDLDLFAGGPPCQGFSLQRRRGYESDERNDLVWDFFRIVSEIKPKAFMLENVVMLGAIRGQKYTSEGFSKLSRLGYKITFGIVNCADYGLAQTRRRFIAVGILGNDYFDFPWRTHNESNYITVGEVLKGLPDCPEDFTEHPSIYNHIRCRITQKNLAMISHVPQGGGWKDIPKNLWLDCMHRWKGASGGWPDVYGRLRSDGQCPTITAGFDSFSRGRYAHPIYNRAITPREAARLQSFPDDFKFYGTRHDVRLQIGNAVPPKIAEVFGAAIKNHLLGEASKRGSFDLAPEFKRFSPKATQEDFWAAAA